MSQQLLSDPCPSTYSYSPQLSQAESFQALGQECGRQRNWGCLENENKNNYILEFL